MDSRRINRLAGICGCGAGSLRTRAINRCIAERPWEARSTVTVDSDGMAYRAVARSSQR